MGIKKARKRRWKARLFFLLLVIVIAFFALTAVFPTLLFLKPMAEISGPGSVEDFFEERINLVILGFDGSAARDARNSLYRPDTIMIASINFRTAEATLASIPRDSYVKIAGRDFYDKINHSYMYGYYSVEEGEDPDISGIRTTLATVRDFLGGVPLHGYIRLDMDGAAALVDSVGGVYFDVAEELRGNYGRGSVQIEEGYQLLDGNKFLHFVRNRADYLGGERGRTLRQQQFARALIDQIKQPRGLIRIPALLLAINEEVETNLQWLQFAALGITGLRLSAQEIEHYVFSGRGQLSERSGQNIYYLVIDEDERVRIIRETFGINTAKREQITLPGPVTSEPRQLTEPDQGDLIPDDPAPQPDPDPDPGPEPDPDPTPDSDPDPDSDPEPDSEPDPEPEPEPEPIPDPDPEPGPEPDPGPEPEADPDPETD